MNRFLGKKHRDRRKSELDTPPPVSRLAWVTKNRPHQVLESVESFIPIVINNNHSVCFCVYDDSDDASDAAHIREGLLEVREKYDVSVRLVTKKDRLEFAGRLKREGKKKNIPPAIIDFALTDVYHAGKAYGVNRNIALLDNFGRLVLFNDDDVLARFARPPDYRPGLKLSSRANPRRMQFYESRKALLDDIDPVEIDLIGEHKRFLGKPVDRVLEEAGQTGLPVDTTEMSPAFRAALRKDPGRIVITHPGIFGNNGNHNPNSFLGWKINAPEFTFCSQEDYYKKMCSSECFYVPPITTVTDKGYFSSTHFGLDARNGLPPFFPLFGGEDTIFGVVTKWCSPAYLFSYPAFGIFHNRKEASALKRTDLTKINNRFGFQLYLLLNTLFGNKDNGEGVDSLSALGEGLHHVGSLADGDFAERISNVLTHYYTQYTGFLLNLSCQEGAGPQWWTEDIAEYKKNIRAALGKPAFIVPEEIKNGPLSAGKHIGFYKELLQKYGELYRYWESIVELTKEITVASDI